MLVFQIPLPEKILTRAYLREQTNERNTHLTAESGRSLLALFAGFVLVVVLTLVTDLVLHATGVFPPPRSANYLTVCLFLATGYRTIYGVAGSYITARLAPYRPM